MIYGHNKTIHGTKELSVEVDENGKVVAVWFRCMPLPFHQSVCQEPRASEMREMYDINRPYPLIAVEVDDTEDYKDLNERF
jgi:hypothetical protein